jgi:hypothetical protein
MTSIDLDFAIDIDSALYDLDGFAVGAATTPASTVGAGGRGSRPVFVPRLVVASARAELGGLDSSATAVRLLDIRAEEDLIMLLL